MFPQTIFLFTLSKRSKLRHMDKTFYCDDLQVSNLHFNRLTLLLHNLLTGITQLKAALQLYSWTPNSTQNFTSTHVTPSHSSWLNFTISLFFEYWYHCFYLFNCTKVFGRTHLKNRSLIYTKRIFILLFCINHSSYVFKNLWKLSSKMESLRMFLSSFVFRWR